MKLHALFLLGLFCPLAGYSQVMDCHKLLPYARIKTTVENSFFKSKNFFSGFCLEEIANSEKGRERSVNVGVDWAKLPIEFGGASRDTETSQYFKNICGAIRSGEVISSDHATVIESIDKNIGLAVEECVAAPGIKMWAEVSERREQVWFYVLPKNAVSECTPGLNRGTSLPSNSPISAACQINSDFKGNDLTFTININRDVGPKTQRVVLPPIPTTEVVVDTKKVIDKPLPPPPPPPPLPELVLKRAGSTRTTYLGEFASIEMAGTSLDGRNFSVPLFELMVVDPGGSFDPGGTLLGTLSVRRLVHQFPGQSEPTPRYDQPVPIPIARSYLGVTPAKFSGLSFTLDQRGQPVTSTEAVFKLDATGAKNFGAEVRGRGCLKDTGHVVTKPGGNGIQVNIPRGLAPNQPGGHMGDNCILDVRLCVLEGHPLYSERTRCP
jgi:hypothetical protein